MNNDFTSDKAKWQWDDAYTQYIQDNNIFDRELTAHDVEEVWELAAGHIVYFLTWIIKHDFYNKEEDLYNEADIQKIKDETMSPFKLFESCNDLILSSDDISDELTGFMNEYYESNEYFNDYYRFMEDIMNIDKQYVKFNYDIYNKFEPFTDEAYRKYLNK